MFAGDGMISSTSEVQARMSYALSQELADTLSRIDGVLTARVHVVLGVNDKVNNITIAPSAAVFLRHTLDSPVVNLVPEIRELVAGARPAVADAGHGGRASGPGRGWLGLWSPSAGPSSRCP